MRHSVGKLLGGIDLDRAAAFDQWGEGFREVEITRAGNHSGASLRGRGMRRNRWVHDNIVS